LTGLPRIKLQSKLQPMDLSLKLPEHVLNRSFIFALH